MMRLPEEESEKSAVRREVSIAVKDKRKSRSMRLEPKRCDQRINHVSPTTQWDVYKPSTPRRGVICMRFTASKGERRSKLSETICENNFVLTDEQISGVFRPQPPSRRARLASWLLFKSLSVESIKLTPLFSNASCSLFFNRFHFHVKWRLEFSRNIIEGRSTTPVLKSFHWLHLARCKHR